MLRQYLFHAVIEVAYFLFRTLPLFLLLGDNKMKLFLFIVLADALYYFCHRFFHTRSWVLCVPLHRFHHASQGSLIGILTSDSLTMLLWLTPLVIVFAISFYVLVYLVVFQSFSHTLSHLISYKVPDFFSFHMRHHQSTRVNFSPIYMDMIFGTIDFTCE